MRMLGETPLNIIVAVDENGGFGNNGEIPWKQKPFMKEDFKRFKALTENSICIMGFRTYEEILKMKAERGGDVNTPLLPNRDSFVVTSRATELPESSAVKFVPSLRSAVEYLDNDDSKNVFVLGGEKLFIEALPWTMNIYMTVVKDRYECDRFFPLEYVDNNFKLGHSNDTDDLYFLTLRRFR